MDKVTLTKVVKATMVFPMMISTILKQCLKDIQKWGFIQELQGKFWSVVSASQKVDRAEDKK